jgi:hypothetical protein
VSREQRKTRQQQEQVRKDDSLVPHVKSETAKAGSGFETGEDELVDHDRDKADQCDR